MNIKKSDYLIKKDLDNLRKEFELIDRNYSKIDTNTFLHFNLSEKLENDFIKDSDIISASLKEIKEKLDSRRNKIISQMYKSKENSKKQINEQEGVFQELLKSFKLYNEEFSLGKYF